MNTFTDLNLDRLLDLLSVILSGQSYKPLGAPSAILRSDSVPVARELSNAEVRPIFCTLFYGNSSHF